jgi:hypothetical protein
MLKNTLQILALLIAFCGAARADDGGDDGRTIPSGYDAIDAVEQYFGVPLSCSDARRTAWFERELARGEGNPEADATYGPCPHEMVAESTAAESD